MLRRSRCKAATAGVAPLYNNTAQTMQRMRRFAVDAAVTAAEILEGLNDSQREAATCTEGPVMIIAGPGSGKTRVLTTRMAYLIGTGRAHPSGILALTFTNKAAREMKERVARLMKNAHLEPKWLGTFHSVFARVLRTEAERLGYGRDFSIYDTDDTERVLRRLMDRYNVDKKQIRPRAIRAKISRAKNSMLGPEAYRKQVDSFAGEQVAKLYGPYQEALRAANALDFDDLLLKPLELFDAHPEVLDKYQRRWSHVHIDEYQDTNHVQYLLANRVAARRKHICVVGDDAQSIYAFRGADIGNILSFQRDYPEAKVVRLEQNYRSTRSILRVASASIRHNTKQLEKELWTENGEGTGVREISCISEKDEAQKVQDLIRELKLRSGYTYDDFAALYRTNAQSRALEEVLRRADVPYQVIGSLSFYQKKEIKDALAYLKVLVNPADEVSLRRIINFPARGIGAKTVERLASWAQREGVSLWDAVKERERVGLTTRALKAVSGFQALIARHMEFEGSPEETARSLILEAGLLSDLKRDDTHEGLVRAENVQELLNAVAEYRMRAEGEVTLAGFLQEVALFTDADAAETGSGRVTLMTLHASKGTEFPVVFITGLEERLFPLAAADKSVTALEEERRLFYVGVTRAEKQLFLLHAMTRLEYGQTQSRLRSRFLEEVQETVGGSGPRPRKRRARVVPLVRRSASETDDRFKVGALVEHPVFGKGRILSVAGRSDARRAVVRFEEEGNKNLMLRFARLRLIDEGGD